MHMVPKHTVLLYVGPHSKNTNKRFICSSKLNCGKWQIDSVTTDWPTFITYINLSTDPHSKKHTIRSIISVYQPKYHSAYYIWQALCPFPSLSEWPQSANEWNEKSTLDFKWKRVVSLGAVRSMLFWKCHTLTHAVNESAGVHVLAAISGSVDPQLCHLARTCELKERQVPDFTARCDWEKIHMLYLSFASGIDSEWSHLVKLCEDSKASGWILPHTVTETDKGTSGIDGGTTLCVLWVRFLDIQFDH